MLFRSSYGHRHAKKCIRANAESEGPDLMRAFAVRQQNLCIEVLPPSQPNGSYRARSVYLNTLLLGQALSSKRLTSIVYTLSPETDNCPS